MKVRGKIDYMPHFFSHPLVVAIIEPVGAHGGMDYYDVGLCDGLVAANVVPILYTSQPITLKTKYSFEIKLFYRRVYEDIASWLRGLLFLVGSSRVLIHAKSNGARICHFHFFHIGVLEFFNLIAAKVFRFRCIVTIHDVEPFVGRLSIPFLTKLTYRIVDHIVVHNKLSKDEIQKILDVKSKTTIIHHGNYLPFLNNLPSKVDARKILKINDTAKVLLFFGQIKQVKGLDILLKACIPIMKEYPDYYLVIAGRPWKDDLNTYEQMIKESGVEKRIISFFRFIDDDELPTFFSASDLIVLPYRRIYQSGVLLMAMSYGIPVLASNIEGMTEIIQDGKTGFLFQSESTQSLSQKIIDAFSDKGKTQDIAESGLKSVKDDYSWEKAGLLTARCYQVVLEHSR